MQMLCTRNDDIIVAVFFDVKTCVTTSTENQGSARDFINQASTSPFREALRIMPKNADVSTCESLFVQRTSDGL